MKKAVILVSGGLDSSTVLAMAKAEGYECYSLSFDYGQRHRSELSAAKKIAELMDVKEHRIACLDLSVFGGSALTDPDIAVPECESENECASEGIPVTYVPARNTVFLSYALAWAEVLEAQDIFIGVNAVDYSGYPDCRPDYIAAYEKMANLATKAGVEGHPVRIRTPLIHLSKADIVLKGVELGVDYSMTVSCYQADDQGAACGRCDSCHLRQEGFKATGLPDPTVYSKSV